MEILDAITQPIMAVSDFITGSSDGKREARQRRKRLANFINATGGQPSEFFHVGQAVKCTKCPQSSAELAGDSVVYFCGIDYKFPKRGGFCPLDGCGLT